jgi:hypothetical protein
MIRSRYSRAPWNTFCAWGASVRSVGDGGLRLHALSGSQAAVERPQDDGVEHLRAELVPRFFELLRKPVVRELTHFVKQPGELASERFQSGHRAKELVDRLPVRLRVTSGCVGQLGQL